MTSNLKRIRTNKKITQAKLSNESGVNLRLIEHYEQQRRDINKAQAYTIYKLAKVLNCTMEELIDIKKEVEE